LGFPRRLKPQPKKEKPAGEQPAGNFVVQRQRQPYQPSIAVCKTAKIQTVNKAYNANASKARTANNWQSENKRIAR
jgi:hypothetical protein